MIFIRVSGPHFEGAGYRWSAREECERTNCVSLPVAPASVSLDITKGDRIFQVLIVSEDTDGQLQLNYGDTSRRLSADVESVKIPLKSLGEAHSEGKAAGRYMTDATSGPKVFSRELISIMELRALMHLKATMASTV